MSWPKINSNAEPLALQPNLYFSPVKRKEACGRATACTFTWESYRSIQQWRSVSAWLSSTNSSGGGRTLDQYSTDIIAGVTRSHGHGLYVRKGQASQVGIFSEQKKRGTTQSKSGRVH
eukprot:1142808-Pelagomonas_calceolata.AAC.2